MYDKSDRQEQCPGMFAGGLKSNDQNYFGVCFDFLSQPSRDALFLVFQLQRCEIALGFFQGAWRIKTYLLFKRSSTIF
jgi:hypothetical protein